MQAPQLKMKLRRSETGPLTGTVSGVVLSRPYKVDKQIKLLQEARLPFCGSWTVI